MPTRRTFLTQLMMSAPAAALANKSEAEAHTLVHIFLRGGADTMNLIVPYADDHYYRARPTLGIKAASTLKLDDRYGLHPALKPLESAFKEGRLGFVQGVGVNNDSGSHFDCQDQMEHGDATMDEPAGGGWLGRFLRLRSDKSQSALSAVAIGTQLPEILRGAPSVSVLRQLDDIAIKSPTGNPAAVAGALQAMYGADVSLLGQRGQQTLDLFKRVAALHGKTYAPANGAAYPAKNTFAEGLREVARLIKAQVGLEVACLDLPGWDTHFLQGTDIGAGSHATNAKALAEGLAAFELDLREQRKHYTVMITTEFGRRIYENASLGTDHGRGFCFMALGDKVKGGRVLGDWPLKAMDETNPLGPGGVEIQHEFRSIFAEVLGGSMGVTDAEASKVLFPGAALAKAGLML